MYGSLCSSSQLRAIRHDLIGAAIIMLAAAELMSIVDKLTSKSPTVQDILDDPTLLKGKSPEEVHEMIGESPGWRVERLGRGTHKGQG